MYVNKQQMNKKLYALNDLDGQTVCTWALDVEVEVMPIKKCFFF